MTGKSPDLGQDHDFHLDAGAAFVAFGIRPERIRQWVRRGKLQIVGRDGRRNLFAAREIERLLDTD